ncbi:MULTISPECIES: hypothetical protein [unclassified Pseudoalteromonas]|uniref:hypothetical protein n=1 Tax=unclassified Pseudoalteromonas TaxID=194690 RepID=UPI001EF0C42D|nr:hypothetical protein [Pseudoalteromonas sp. L21]MCF7518217.1 hypothetical protein [Pseudoalteromonas sp. L21]UJX27590.1 hypothetical protein L3Q70_16755 [Pseudoalteromonas sp. CF6-2]
MIKRILLSALFMAPCFAWGQQALSVEQCESMQAERAELQSAIRKTHLLDKIDSYKQRLHNLSSRISDNCLTDEQILKRTHSFYNQDIAYLENPLAKPLSEQGYISKQAAWERYYVIPSRCLHRPLNIQYLDWCIENKQVQFQQFDMLWQQKSAQYERAEAKSTDSFHEFVLPSKSERARIMAERELKRYSYTNDTILPTNIIVLCALAVTVFFSLIFIFHFLMRPRPAIKD